MKFSPRRKKGFDLTDGEMLERVWAYVRKFGKMTKEMRPSHRVDVLSDVLLHYGLKTKQKLGNCKECQYYKLYKPIILFTLGNMLAERMKKAINIENAAKCDIEKLCQCLDCTFIDIECFHVI